MTREKEACQKTVPMMTTTLTQFLSGLFIANTYNFQIAHDAADADTDQNASQHIPMSFKVGQKQLSNKELSCDAVASGEQKATEPRLYNRNPPNGNNKWTIKMNIRTK